MITEGTILRAGAARAKSRAAAAPSEEPAPRARRSSQAALTPEEHRELMWMRIGWVAALLVWIFVAIALLTFNPSDWPTHSTVPENLPAANLCGIAGAAVAWALYSVFGGGMWVIMTLAAAWLVITVMGRTVTHLPVRTLGALLFAAVAACFQSLIMPASGPVPNLPGGVVGTVGTHELLLRFNAFGTVIWLLLGLVIAATVTLDVWALLFAMWTGRVLYTGARHTGRIALGHARTFAERRAAIRALREQELAAHRGGAVRETDVDDDENLTGIRAGEMGLAVARQKVKKAPTAAAAPIDPTAGGIGGAESFDETFDRAGGGLTAGRAGVEEEDDDIPVAEEVEPEQAGGLQPQTKSFSPDELRAKIAKLPVRFAGETRRSATDEDLRDIQNTQDLEGYRFPGLDMLEEPETNFTLTMEAYVREQAEALERALREYRIEGEVVGVESGPVITLYELRLAPGTKVAALSAVSSDLARALKAINIRIVPNMEGRDTVGVEVPNAQKEKVRLKELMTKSEVYASMRLPMFLGKDASGEPMIEDLAKMPHMLIAGTTGSGKSVCMNTIIMSFLYTKKPNELKLVLVDPKMVEMSQFKDIPHLMCPVVTEMSKAAAILEWAVNKMDERYELLAEAGCRDIAAYNELTWEELKERYAPSTPEEEAKIPRKLPYMVFVIDELADLIMTNKEVEHSIVRIAQKARAVGIHLILATQRPQANVVTGLIKSNMPARIAFKVASGMDSRIVLDQKGGELLLGQGDMLYLSPKSSKLVRAQGTLVDDKEIRRVVKFMREIASPTFERSIMQLKGTTADGDEASEGGMGGTIDTRGLANAQTDPLFDQAVEVVLETKRGSVSLLQRRFGIGFTRAGRLIELMGEAGILGTHKGTVAREVTMTLEEWKAMKAQALADAEEAENGSPSKPIADTLEQAQSIVNDGNLREQIEESDGKATDEIEDEAGDVEDAEGDEADEAAEDDGDDEPPFKVETRVKTMPTPRQ
ncbi:MAG TPA: DNA translocase FtsK [Phycisphaerales bacterium]|nr:DNA translocase FtsK [Phycisphaerales bacterium]